MLSVPSRRIAALFLATVIAVGVLSASATAQPRITFPVAKSAVRAALTDQLIANTPAESAREHHLDDCARVTSRRIRCEFARVVGDAPDGEGTMQPWLCFGDITVARLTRKQAENAVQLVGHNGMPRTYIDIAKRTRARVHGFGCAVPSSPPVSG